MSSAGNDWWRGGGKKSKYGQRWAVKEGMEQFQVDRKGRQSGYSEFDCEHFVPSHEQQRVYSLKPSSAHAGAPKRMSGGISKPRDEAHKRFLGALRNGDHGPVSTRSYVRKANVKLRAELGYMAAGVLLYRFVQSRTDENLAELELLMAKEEREEFNERLQRRLPPRLVLHFVGGRRDEEDQSKTATALREFNEETSDVLSSSWNEQSNLSRDISAERGHAMWWAKGKYAMFTREVQLEDELLWSIDDVFDANRRKENTVKALVWVRRADLEAAHRSFPRALSRADFRLPQVSTMVQQIMDPDYGGAAFEELLDQLERSVLADASA